MTRKKNHENQFNLEFEQDPIPQVSPEPSQRVVDASEALAEPETILELLSRWRAADWIRPLDVEFARLIRSLSGEQGEEAPPLLLLLAALTSHQVGRGHVCVDLGELMRDAGQVVALPPEESLASSVAPQEMEQLPRPGELLAGIALTDCLAALDRVAAVSEGSQSTPLVLDGHRLYLRRFWRYEQKIARGIRDRLALPSSVADSGSAEAGTLKQALAALFGSQAGVDYQKLACALAARNRFAVITGGPGTGKTTTVVNLLAALQSVAGASPLRQGRKYRIRLAAPTGKAAARLNESIGGAVSRLPLDQLPGQVTVADIPTRVTTLHRLLGSRPDTRQFRHNRDNPLLVDILVIDEASMVDVDLMASVFDALPGSTHLILLGDKDQLASVDAGAVLGELCQRAQEAHYRPGTTDWLQAITGDRVPDDLTDPEGQAMDQAVAMLRRSYRFTETSGIRQLAEAVNTNALDDAMLEGARNGNFEDVAWLDTGVSTEETRTLVNRHALTGTPGAFRHQGQGRVVGNQPVPPPVGYRHYLSLMKDHELAENSPREAWDALAQRVLAAFGDFQVLCALRQGPWGVEGLNDQIARHLLGEQLIPRAEGWYAGRPVLVTGNDYNLGLMNGDVGITFSLPWDQDEAGRTRQVLRVAFSSSDGSGNIRWISPSRLQQLETNYAMTVHKSQGSEFNHTCLVLPDRLSPVMTRELVYTGITRARNWFSLITGNEAVLRESVRQRVIRASGLAERLWQ
ncbi:DNA helicase/exodeoxyribonuclease V, alpha subunit [Marinobacter daqiaonensis]|uniref:RecBCD enzyme subunit RecD n=1 Tax=Marinobacter daqiaonensis TaxID=650891 RepID=A0A1I6I5P8_9GAMM|nr:exodeoxyribonuclease V subunit alpha [Marinobacter daqiaonensis]SFR62042.1 DNA helicase/exodeoxyribonuclease V, alpha subunit [Marinobacter daqiaonensis]